MKLFSNLFNRVLPKGKAKDSKDIVISPPPTSSYQKETFPQFPALKEWSPPTEQSPRSMSALTSIASFDPLSDSGPSPPSLPTIGDTMDHITTSTTHPSELNRQEVIREIVASEER